MLGLEVDKLVLTISQLLSSLIESNLSHAWVRWGYCFCVWRFQAQIGITAISDWVVKSLAWGSAAWWTGCPGWPPLWCFSACACPCISFCYRSACIIWSTIHGTCVLLWMWLPHWSWMRWWWSFLLSQTYRLNSTYLICCIMGLCGELFDDMERLYPSTIIWISVCWKIKVQKVSWDGLHDTFRVFKGVWPMTCFKESTWCPKGQLRQFTLFLVSHIQKPD